MTEVKDDENLQYVILNPPEPIGFYKIGKNGDRFDIILTSFCKPNIVVKFFMKHLLGIYWVENKERKVENK
jgi:hypothetical protein